MEISSKIVRNFGTKKFETRMATFNKQQSYIVEGKLIEQKDKIVKYLRKLESEGTIKSIFRPKNKKIQADLNIIIQAKREINKTIEKIRVIFR